MSKNYLYVCNDDSTKDVTTPYCFSCDEAAKRFFIQNALAAEVPFDNFTFFKVGEFIINYEGNDVSFKLISFPSAIPVALSSAECSEIVDSFYATHPLTLENKKLKEELFMVKKELNFLHQASESLRKCNESIAEAEE